MPGLATGAVGHSLFYSPVVSGFSPPRGRFVDTTGGDWLTQKIRMPAVTSSYGVSECASPG